LSQDKAKTRLKGLVKAPITFDNMVRYGWTSRARWGKREVMAKKDETQTLSWPWWAPWALLAVVATSVLTIAATLYDIL
jgi:hypothetical protein